MTVALRERPSALAVGNVRAEGLLAALVCAAGGLLIVVLRSRLTFFNDDWYFLFQRPGLESGGGLDTLLAPHNGNIVVLLALMFKALVAAFGLGPQLPWALLEGITVAVLGWLVFVLVDERLGPVAGLAAAAVVVFMGPAWEALLFFTSISHLGALTLGVAALLALEADTPGRNAAACALLVCAILLLTAAIPFLVGAAIVVLLVRRRPRQLWIAAVPAALFALWWAFYGHKQSSGVTVGHIEHLPRYLYDAVSSGLASATGLVHASLPAVLSSGHLLTVLAAVLLVWWLIRGGRPSSWAIVFAGTALSFWLLTGASAIPGRAAQASRYQATNATLLILLAAELLRGIRIGRSGLAVLSGATVLVVASNLLVMRQGYDFMRAESQTAKVSVGALEILGHAARPDMMLTASTTHDLYLSGVTAGRYFGVTRAHGAPPFSSADEIASSPIPLRETADNVLASGYGIAAEPVRAAAPRTGCPRLGAGVAQAGPALPLSPRGALVSNITNTPLVMGVSHFAPAARPAYFAFLAGHGTERIDIPPPAANIRWRLSLTTGGRPAFAGVVVCQA